MSNWQQYRAAGESWQDDQGRIRHFGTAPTGQETNLVSVCDHLHVLGCRGEDARDFLQGQISADVREVDTGSSRAALHLNLKGRGVTGMRVVSAADGYDLLVDQALLEATRQALGKFILRSRVQLEPDPDRVILRISGPDSAQLLTAAELPRPAADTTEHTDRVTVTRPRASEQYLVIAPAAEAASLLDQRPDSFTLGGMEHARLQAILDGDGQVLAGARERFMPQELNYDLLSGISFKKGCYVGQEVVARMHFRGHLKQRMRRLSWPAANPPEPGTALRNDQGRGRGEIVDAVMAGERCQALVVLQHHCEDTLSTDATTLAWHLETLPYDVPDDG